MLEDKVELSTIHVAPQDGAPKHEGSQRGAVRDDASYVEKQTRTRRLFSKPQIFCFAMMYFASWSGAGSNMYFSLINGGPAALFFNVIIACTGAVAQAAALGEVASLMPIAGAQYYWTYHFAPPKHKMLLTWISGWATWLGYICSLAGVLNSCVLLQQAGIQINWPDYEITGWRTTLFIFGNLAVLTIFNVWLFKLVPWFELFAGILNICFFFVTVVALWVMSPRNNASSLLDTAWLSGWDNNFVAWNVGMLTQVWLFIGFESVVHMGEETKAPGSAIPFTMVWAIVANGVMAAIITITYVICMPDIQETASASYPLLHLFMHATNGSKPLVTILFIGQNLAGVACSMSFLSSVSRMTWAWARDGGLPRFFGHVHGKRRVPVRAIALTCTLVMLLALLNLNGAGFIALGAITSLSSLALYFSYAIILSIILHVRLTTGLPKADWSIGRWSIPVNIFALVYTVWTMIFLPFPTTVPVDATTMNYSGPVFLAVIFGALGAWVFYGKNKWPGPNMAIVDYVLKAEHALLNKR